MGLAGASCLPSALSDRALHAPFALEPASGLSHCLNTRQQLCPPNPRELLMAVRTARGRPWFERSPGRIRGQLGVVIVQDERPTMAPMQAMASRLARAEKVADRGLRGAYGHVVGVFA